MEVRDVLSRGVSALSRSCKFSPWNAREEFTMADIYIHYVNTIVNVFGANQFNWDVLAEIPGMKAWNETMSQSDLAKNIETDRLVNMHEFITKVKAQVGAATIK